MDRRACRQVSSLSGGPQIRWGRRSRAKGRGSGARAPKKEVKAARSRKWRRPSAAAESPALGIARPCSTLRTAGWRGDEAFRANPGSLARPPPRLPERRSWCRETGSEGSEACSHSGTQKLPYSCTFQKHLTYLRNPSLYASQRHFKRRFCVELFGKRIRNSSIQAPTCVIWLD